MICFEKITLLIIPVAHTVLDNEASVEKIEASLGTVWYLLKFTSRALTAWAGRAWKRRASSPELVVGHNVDSL